MLYCKILHRQKAGGHGVWRRLAWKIGLGTLSLFGMHISILSILSATHAGTQPDSSAITIVYCSEGYNSEITLGREIMYSGEPKAKEGVLQKIQESLLRTRPDLGRAMVNQ